MGEVTSDPVRDWVETSVREAAVRLKAAGHLTGATILVLGADGEAGLRVPMADARGQARADYFLAVGMALAEAGALAGIGPLVAATFAFECWFALRTPAALAAETGSPADAPDRIEGLGVIACAADGTRLATRAYRTLRGPDGAIADVVPFPEIAAHGDVELLEWFLAGVRAGGTPDGAARCACGFAGDPDDLARHLGESPGHVLADVPGPALH